MPMLKRSTVLQAESRLGSRCTEMRRQFNAQLRRMGCKPLTLEELIGGRLYTGPMYVKCTTVALEPMAFARASAAAAACPFLR